MKSLAAVAIFAAVLLAGCGQGMPGRGGYCKMKCSDDSGQKYLDCLKDCDPTSNETDEDF